MTNLSLWLLESKLNKSIPTPRVSISSKIVSVDKKHRRLIPRKLSLFGSRALINQTNRTRSVWDPKGYQAQAFLNNVYRKV